MKRLLMLVLVLALLQVSLQAFAFSGHITESTTWISDVVITGDTWINPGVTLEIGPGVQVLFAKVDANQDDIGDLRFVINGSLIANGSSVLPVVFGSFEQDAEADDWYGIIDSSEVNSTKSRLNHVLILHSHRALTIDTDSLELNHCTILDPGDYGIRAKRAPYFRIDSSTVNGSNIYGLRLEEGTSLNSERLIVVSCGTNGIEMAGSGVRILNEASVLANHYNGLLCDAASPIFSNSSFSWNGYHGISAVESSAPQVSHSNINNNTIYGVYFENSGGSITYSNIEDNLGLGVTIANSNPIINYCNIPSNASDTSATLLSTDGEFNGEWPFRPEEPLFGEFDVISDAFSTLIITGVHIICGGNRHTVLDGADIWGGVFNDSDEELASAGNHAPAFIATHIDTFLITPITSRTALRYHIDWRRNNNQRTIYYDIPEIQIRKTALSAFCGVWNPSQEVADLQFNWWGQVSGVDSLVYQDIAGTANYQQYELSPISGSGPAQTNTPPFVQVTEPQNSIQTTTSVTVSWSVFDPDDNPQVRLYFGSRRESTGTLLAGPFSAFGGPTTYEWDVSSLPGGVYYLYAIASDGINPDVLAYAPGSVMVGEIAVIHPNGGETLFATIPDTIRWESLEFSGNVCLELNRTYPSDAWEVLVSTTPNDGLELWEVFGNPTSSARIRITSISDPSVGDTSNSEFSIISNEPATPEGLIITRDGESAWLSWDKVDTTVLGYPINVERYLVFFRNNEDLPWQFLTATHGADSTSFVHRDVFTFSPSMYYNVRSWAGEIAEFDRVIELIPVGTPKGDVLEALR